MDFVDRPFELRQGKSTKTHKKIFDYKKVKSFSSRYLKTYYTAVDPDEEAIAKFLVKHFKKLKSLKYKPKMIEIGCGPTIHHVLPAAPYVSTIEMYDYLDENIAELRKWINKKSSAHNWHCFTRKILEFEGLRGKDKVVRRENLLRSKIKKLGRCDVLCKHPIGRPDCFPVVGFFYVAEEVGIDKSEWEKIMLRVCNMVRPGGYLFLAALRATHFYSVMRDGGRIEKLPTAYVVETDFINLLKKAGFDTKRSVVECTLTPSMKKETGITGVILVAAKKLSNSIGSQIFHIT